MGLMIEAAEAWVIYGKDGTPLDIALTLEDAEGKAATLLNIPADDHSWGVNVGGFIGCWNKEGDKVFCQIGKYKLNSAVFLRYPQKDDLLRMTARDA